MWNLGLLFVQTLAAALAVAPDPAQGRLELVESAPVETSLDAPDLRPPHEVWIECIERARESIDIAQFYASDAPPGADGTPRRTRLTEVVEALERAAGRGVRVRFLLSEGFRETYPELPARLGALEGLEVRWLDLRPLTGGTLHAKYWIFDSESLFLGSQNFDWRALEHIQELGILTDDGHAVAGLRTVFESDWARCVGEPGRRVGLARLGQGQGVFPVSSPRDLVPVDEDWDLPRIVELLEGAERSIRVQLLSYSPTDREGAYFAELDNALRAAAARGVEVRLMVADWGKRQGRVEWLQSLQAVPSLTVRFVTIPQASKGFIPFARCIHAKYLVVDAERAWLGTGNWSRSYFHEGRNVGLILEGGSVPGRLHRFHADTWNSPYAYGVDPGATYVPPRVGE